MEKYFRSDNETNTIPLLDGMITNRADLTINFYYDQGVRKNKIAQTSEEILNDLEY